MLYPLCFPVVIHGLFVDKIRKNQVDIVNNLFRDDFDEDTYGSDYFNNIKQDAVSRYATGNEAIPNTLADDVVADADKLIGRIKRLQIPDIEVDVSAFHTFVATRSSLDRAEIARLGSIIFEENNPEKYIAEAILISMRYREKTSSFMTKKFQAELHKLHTQPWVKNLFRLSAADKLRYMRIPATEETEIFEEIADLVLIKSWIIRDDEDESLFTVDPQEALLPPDRLIGIFCDETKIARLEEAGLVRRPSEITLLDESDDDIPSEALTSPDGKSILIISPAHKPYENLFSFEGRVLTEAGKTLLSLLPPSGSAGVKKVGKSWKLIMGSDDGFVVSAYNLSQQGENLNKEKLYSLSEEIALLAESGNVEQEETSVNDKFPEIQAEEALPF